MDRFCAIGFLHECPPASVFQQREFAVFGSIFLEDIIDEIEREGFRASNFQPFEFKRDACP